MMDFTQHYVNYLNTSHVAYVSAVKRDNEDGLWRGVWCDEGRTILAMTKNAYIRRHEAILVAATALVVA